MSTIASLVAKLGLDDTDLTTGATRASGTITRLAQTTVAANAKMMESACQYPAWASGPLGLARANSTAKQNVKSLTTALDAATGPSATVTDNLKLLAATQGGIAAVSSTIGTVTGAMEALAAAGGVALGGVAVAVAAVAAAAYRVEKSVGSLRCRAAQGRRSHGRSGSETASGSQGGQDRS